MTGSSPADLAVTFRTIPRRRAEARGDAPAEVTTAAEAELDALIGSAGRLLTTRPDPPAIAAAIETIHPGQWDEATLDSLRAIALDIGRVLRRLAELTAG